MTEQNEQNEQQAAEALRAGRPIILAPGPKGPTGIPLPPHDVWDLAGGTAWVYYGEGNQGLTRPVILADGFNIGPSTAEFSWDVLEFGAYPFISELRRRGRDVILLGFHDRSASILQNACAAADAIQRAIMERLGDAALVVGGFSMGGLVTRYTLARLEYEGLDHQTALYFSYDSPHRGASIPIALQAFGHCISRLDSRFSDQINSPASQQLLWRHIAEWDAEPRMSKEREEFLAELARVGWWPALPHKIGVANGPGDGTGNGMLAGQKAVEGKGTLVTGTHLFTQAEGFEQLVAQLRVVTPRRNEVHTTGFPEIDGAPGGTLEGFGILADALGQVPGFETDAAIREHCFVPAVSAVDVRDLDSTDDLYVPIDSLPPDESGLDEFKLASRNEEHALMTEELGSWIIDRLP